jgi:hypothetical protein
MFCYLEYTIILETLFLVTLCRSHSKGEHYDSEASEIEHRAHSLKPTIRDEQAVLEYFWEWQQG